MSSKIIAGTTSGTALNMSADTSGILEIQTGSGPTTAITVDAGQRTMFPTTIGVGGATPSTSGAGITFPATQSNSSDANTLDDYEEGTWTPTDASGAGLTFTINTTSTYTKIGNFVTAYCSVTYPATASAAQATFGGLPFVSASIGFGGGFNKYSTYPGTVIGACATSNTIIFAYTNQGVPLSNANMTTARIDYVISYRSA